MTATPDDVTSPSLRRRRRVVVLAALGLLLVACTRGSAEETTTTSGPTTTAPGDEPAPETVTFHVGLLADLTTTNSWAALDSESSTWNSIVILNGHPRLFTVAYPDFQVVPLVSAAGPEQADQDGETWVVEQELRSGLLWSDGTPVSAADLVFTFETVREFELGGTWESSFPEDVTGMTAPDATTVRVEFSAKPGLGVWQNGVGLASWRSAAFWGDAVEAAREAAAQAAAEVEALSDEDIAELIADQATGTDEPSAEDIAAYRDDAGPRAGREALYAVDGTDEPIMGGIDFVEWEPGQMARSVANPDHYYAGTVYTTYEDGAWRQANPQRGFDEVYYGEGDAPVRSEYSEGPFVDEIVYHVYQHQAAAVLALKNGEIDYIFNPLGLSPGLRRELEGAPNLEFIVNPSEGFRYLAFNMRKTPLSIAAFRRALATIIDKEYLADRVLGAEALPAYAVVPEENGFWHNAQVRVDYPGFGLSEERRFREAVAILEEAGFEWDTPPVFENNDVKPGEGLRDPSGQAIPELEILAPSAGYDPMRATAALWITQWLNDLGVPARVTLTDINTIVSTVFTRDGTKALDWDMFLLAWSSLDPSLPDLKRFFHSDNNTLDGGLNASGYSSADFDALADEWESAETLQAAREAVLAMEELLAQDLPYVVLFRTPVVEAYRNTVVFPVTRVLGGVQGFPNGFPSAVSIE